jgi:hypothetical protein
MAKEQKTPPPDPIDEASEESFPASDPPAHGPTVGPHVTEDRDRRERPAEPGRDSDRN